MHNLLNVLSAATKPATPNFDKNLLLNKINNLRFSVDTFHSYVTILGAGVIAGFICRRYLKLLIVSGLLAVLVIKSLEKQSLLKIHWSAITELIGIDHSLTVEQVLQEIYEIAAKNIYLSLAGVFGFLIGYRAG